VSEPGFGGDGARTGQQLDKWAADIAANAQTYQDMSREVAALTVREASRDNVVEVTVDARGALTDLRISDRVRELSGQEVAALVLGTMRRAQHRITDKVAEVMAPMAAKDPQTVQTVVAGYEQRFPEPPPEGFVEGNRNDEVQEMDLGGGTPEEFDSGPRRRRPAPRRRAREDDDFPEDGFGGPIIN
jgi:DNA-binding protein YbaB